MEIAIKEGQTALQVLSVINLEEVHKKLDAELDIYKNYIVTEQTEKQDKETLESLKTLRKPVKDLRAKVNKELKAITENELKKIDDITAKLDAVIKPIESGLDIFAEERRLKKRAYKDEKFISVITDINNTIESIDIPFLTLEQVTFNEEWYNMADDKIMFALDDILKNTLDKIQTAKDRIELMTMYAAGIKEQYLLKSEIDIYFKGQLYSLPVAELKEMIEEKAVEQHKIENVVIEKVQEEIKINKEVEEKNKVVEMQPDIKSKKYDFTLRIENCDVNKAKMLKDFLEINEIKYDFISKTEIIQGG